MTHIIHHAFQQLLLWFFFFFAYYRYISRFVLLFFLLHPFPFCYMFLLPSFLIGIFFQNKLRANLDITQEYDRKQMEAVLLYVPANVRPSSPLCGCESSAATK